MGVTEYLSRRTFSKGVVATSIVGIDSSIETPPSHRLERLSRLKRIENKPLTLTPPILRQIGFNCPYLASMIHDPEVMDHMTQQLAEEKNAILRVFFPNKGEIFEERFGHYQMGLLDDIVQLSTHFPIGVSLADGFYWRQNKLNLAYAFPKDLTLPPYLTEAKGDTLLDRQIFFLTNLDMQKKFFNAVAVKVTALNQYPNIKYWDVNEMDPATWVRPHLKDIFNAWFVKLITTIKKADDSSFNRPIVSGTANPLWIDERLLKDAGLAANCVHLYPDMFPSLFWYMHMQKRELPLIVQELGFPYELLGVPLTQGQDQRLARYTELCLYQLMGVNEREGWFEPYTSGISLWRVGMLRPPHMDNYGYYLDQIPETMGILHKWDQLVNG